MRALQNLSNYGCNRDRTGGDGAGRLRGESVRFVRDGARVFWNLMRVPCVRRSLRSIHAYVPCLAIYMIASASVAAFASEPYSVVSGRDGRAVALCADRCAMYGISTQIIHIVRIQSIVFLRRVYVRN